MHGHERPLLSPSSSIQVQDQHHQFNFSNNINFFHGFSVGFYSENSLCLRHCQFSPNHVQSLVKYWVNTYIIFLSNWTILPQISIQFTFKKKQYYHHFFALYSITITLERTPYLIVYVIWSSAIKLWWLFRTRACLSTAIQATVETALWMTVEW